MPLVVRLYRNRQPNSKTIMSLLTCFLHSRQVFKILYKTATLHYCLLPIGAVLAV